MEYTIYEKVIVIIANQFDVSEDSINESTDLRNDLGADSLDAVDLLMDIDDEFELDIPDEEIIYIRTIGDVVKYIEDHI